MKIKQIIRYNRILFFANLVVFIGIIGVFTLGEFSFFQSNEVLEAKRIILRGKNGIPNIVLQGDDENTLLTLNDTEGNVRLQLQGGNFPALIIKNDHQEIVGTFFSFKRWRCRSWIGR